MESANSYKYLTLAGTYLLAGNEVKPVNIHGIEINRTLAGTLTIQADASGTPVTIGIIAAGTLPGSYWISTNGIQINDAQIVISNNEDVTVIYTNIG